MEKSLMDCKPLGNAEPCENYENLPFHGMQNPPAKVREKIRAFYILKNSVEL